jgi:hypothetical protein
MLWVHFKSKAEGIGKPKEQTRDIQKVFFEKLVIRVGKIYLSLFHADG